MGFDLDPSYKQVPERIGDLKEKHPEARLRPINEDEPFKVLEMPDGKVFIVYGAACHRDKDDTLPGVGYAWEPYPGRTPFTKDSELQNAETSAWGRAIVACLASESKSVASAEDVRNRQADHDAPPPGAKPSNSRECVVCHQDLAGAKAKKHGQGWVHDPLCETPAENPDEEPF